MLTDVIDVYTITEDVAILHNAIALVNADPVLYKKAPHFGGGPRVAGDVRGDVQALRRKTERRVVQHTI